MLQFFKYVLATIIGLFLFMVLSFFLIIGLGAAFSGGDKATTVKENSVLQIDLNKNITELNQKEDEFSALFNNGVSSIGLGDLKTAIANAKLDPNIKAISLKLEFPMIGFAQIEELRAALIDFKKSGKKIYTYGEIMSEKAIYISALADKSFINPAGGVEFNGLDAEYTFFKGTLDKLGIKPLVFKVGEFKSAVEPYIRTDMSPESEMQTKEYLGGIANYMYDNIAKDRKISRSELEGILNEAKIQEPEDAVKYKLLSHVGYEDQFEAEIKKDLGKKDSEKISYVKLGAYKNAKKYIKESTGTDKIAVIVSEGTIVYGAGQEGVTAEDFIKELKRARNDKKVKAIVLRIDSPGGSALASDLMWREIEITKKIKPVIASMGNVAASGGYYMAMGCDTIVAQPNTITGSIGIFGILFNLKNFMNDKLGLSTDAISTHAYANSPSLTRDMSQAEMNMIQTSVNKGYEKFTSKAAAGRGMSLEQLKSVAGGRVWTGAQAKEKGLVDVLGGLDVAIKIAAQKAKLKEGAYGTKFLPYPKSAIEELTETFTKSKEDAFLKENLGLLAPHSKQVMDLLKQEKLQARMPYLLEIK